MIGGEVGLVVGVVGVLVFFVVAASVGVVEGCVDEEAFSDFLGEEELIVVLLVVVGLVGIGEGVEGAVGGEGVFGDALPGLIGFFFA